ncbi:hypothetical protein [Xanthomonas sp. MUS 060]|uniref:hypothetical protein n=1 Tax=Xanthomonas sp. MUS 060 TaxID=1588031 RepID=UPI0005F29762|nr:hypothetical protein [Xanthomonas sp. MUS 060]
MTRAADILDALLARMSGGLPCDPLTGLPDSWAHWLASQPVAPRTFVASELIAALPQPLPAVSMRLPALSPWQALRRLWWQHWDPAPYDQRWWRRIAVLLSLLLHLLFAVFLLWVAFVRWLPLHTDDGQASRVQVEFVGRGTPADTGGGASAALTTPPKSAAPVSATRVPHAVVKRARSTAKTSTSPASVAAASANVPVAAKSPPPPEQSLQVTETPTPTSDFVLPPPPRLRTPVPTPRSIVPPEIQVTERDVQVVTEAPALAQIRPREVVVPRPAAPTLQVREREVPAPLSQVQVQSLPMPNPMPMPELAQAQAPQVRQIEIPTPATVSVPVPTAAAAVKESSVPAVAPAPVTQASTPTTQQATPAASASATAPPGQHAATPGSGPATAAREGSWATPQRSDDWGAAARNRAGDVGGGARNGLFNGDGSVRLADGAGANKTAEHGAPGADTDTWTRERIANAGQWLKRPPYDYTPTSFDKYWLPNATLLEEWVRRGIQSVSIPIPGTGSSITCVISILQVGGGCGITDPNLNDQPAGARPPPKVPFKPALQEDNGSR